MTILAYFVDILYEDETQRQGWLTVEERNALIGDKAIVAATYIPAVRKTDGDRMNAIAWLLETIVPGPAITTSQQAAISAWMLGVTVTPLQLAAYN